MDADAAVDHCLSRMSASGTRISLDRPQRGSRPRRRVSRGSSGPSPVSSSTTPWSRRRRCSQFHTMLRLGRAGTGTPNGLQQSYGDHNRLAPRSALDTARRAAMSSWYRSLDSMAAGGRHGRRPPRVLRRAWPTSALTPSVLVALWLGAALHDCGMLGGRGSYVDVEDGVVLAAEVIDCALPADVLGRRVALFAPAPPRLHQGPLHRRGPSLRDRRRPRRASTPRALGDLALAAPRDDPGGRGRPASGTGRLGMRSASEHLPAVRVRRLPSPTPLRCDAARRASLGDGQDVDCRRVDRVGPQELLARALDGGSFGGSRSSSPRCRCTAWHHVAVLPLAAKDRGRSAGRGLASHLDEAPADRIVLAPTLVAGDIRSRWPAHAAYAALSGSSGAAPVQPSSG